MLEAAIFAAILCRTRKPLTEIPIESGYQFRSKILFDQQVYCRKRKKKGLFFLLFASIILFTSAALIYHAFPFRSPQGPPRKKILKREVSRSLTSEGLIPLLKRNFKKLESYGEFTAWEESLGRLTVETTLDPGLQSYAARLLSKSMTREGAIVVSDPATGRILALASRGTEDGELPVYAIPVPAASIFKIITAASALDRSVLSPSSVLSFNGNRYTLYKSQLKKRRTRYTHFITLEKAFAESINPVFGKIGIYHVGSKTLMEYGRRFGFNRSLPVDLPHRPSRLVKPSTTYEIAEIASGFNKKTMISAIHAVLIPQTILNQGRLRSLRAIEEVYDSGHRKLYRYMDSTSTRVVSKKTAGQLRRLMRATILKGTARRTFYRMRKWIRRGILEIGAKTGNINNDTDTVMYDWFVGYAVDKRTQRAICFSVLGIHEGKLGIRSLRLGRSLIKKFFRL